ncbi:hypothetical protein BH11MYX1_BH11MYX1_00300 [soil metagenome]
MGMTPVYREAVDPLIESLTRLKQTWPGTQWEWDGRFAAISSSFTIDLEREVRESARFAFPRGWTVKSIEHAPAMFRALADKTCMRPNQRLLAGDELTAPTLFGLWWPWGGGDKITLRIGLLDADAAVAPVSAIRELFGVIG